MAKIATGFDVIKNIFGNKRMQSFYWRTGMMCLAVIFDQAIILLGGLGLTTPAIVILGLVLGEISKSIHNSLK